MANFESLNLLTGRKKESLELENEREVLVSVDEASPSTARRMERSKSLSEKNKTSLPGKPPKSDGFREIDEKELSRWSLVNAVTVSDGSPSLFHAQDSYSASHSSAGWRYCGSCYRRKQVS